MRSSSLVLQLVGRLPKLTEVCLLGQRLLGESHCTVSQILISHELISRAFNFEQCFKEDFPAVAAGDLKF